MNKPYKSIFEKEINPLRIAGFVIIGVIVIISISWLFGKTGLMQTKDIFPWEMAFSGILFYALFSGIFSLAHKDQNKYFLHSVIAFVGLTAVLCIFAWLFSGLSIDEAGSFRWLLIIFTFSYLLIMSIVRAMKKIVKMAQKQDSRLRGEEDAK